jgi:DNA-binding CsgD family transcriptional regulator
MGTSGRARRPSAGLGDALTAREREILALVAEGERTAAIAQRMGIAANTVKSHCTSAYKKIGARNRVEATRWYMANLAQPRGSAASALGAQVADLQERLDALPPGAPDATLLRDAIAALQALDRGRPGGVEGASLRDATAAVRRAGAD